MRPVDHDAEERLVVERSPRGRVVADAGGAGQHLSGRHHLRPRDDPAAHAVADRHRDVPAPGAVADGRAPRREDRAGALDGVDGVHLQRLVHLLEDQRVLSGVIGQVRVRVDEAGHDRAPAHIDDPGLGGHPQRRGGTHRLDHGVLDDDAAPLARCCSGAVDEPTVDEDERRAHQRAGSSIATPRAAGRAMA